MSEASESKPIPKGKAYLKEFPSLVGRKQILLRDSEGNIDTKVIELIRRWEAAMRDVPGFVGFTIRTTGFQNSKKGILQHLRLRRNKAAPFVKVAPLYNSSARNFDRSDFNYSVLRSWADLPRGAGKKLSLAEEVIGFRQGSRSSFDVRRIMDLEAGLPQINEEIVRCMLHLASVSTGAEQIDVYRERAKVAISRLPGSTKIGLLNEMLLIASHDEVETLGSLFRVDKNIDSSFMLEATLAIRRRWEKRISKILELKN